MKLNSGRIYHHTIIVVFFTMFAITNFSCHSAMQEKKVTVPPTELPVVIRNAIEREFPDGQVIAIEKEVEGEDPGQYDVELLSNGKEYEVEISPEGKVIEIKEKTPATETSGSEQSKEWTDSFDQENCTFSSTGRNRFFILEPGYQLVLQSSEEKVVITVLNETKIIGNIETRIVEEREEEDGELKTQKDGFLPLDIVTSRHIKQALKMTNGKIHGPSGAASLLGLNPSTLRHRMRKLGISHGRGK